MIDVKTNVIRIIQIEMTEEDANKVYQATQGDVVSSDREFQDTLLVLGRAILIALHPNMVNPDPINRRATTR